MSYSSVAGRIALVVDGQKFTAWTSVQIERDLHEIAGAFRLEYLDQGREAQTLATLLSPPPFFEMVKQGMACRIDIDGEPVLLGWIDDVELERTATTLRARIAGRDRTGDLVDCAALPTGPSEFTGVDLLHVATTVCAPYGIVPRAETDIGAPFERLSLRPHETALQFLEKAARQRSVLLVSDGVGGLLLTRGGATRGPWPIATGDNVVRAGARMSWRRRFSDVYVKGQTDSRRQRAGIPAPLDHTAVPLVPGGGAPAPTTAPGPKSKAEAPSIIMTGHARDPQITRFRPTVRLTRSQSGMSSAQEQAEWGVRIARGEGDQLTYTVLDWRAGPKQVLWRPNQVVPVSDPYADIGGDMLIAGLRYALSGTNCTTELRVVGVTAYDRINEAERRRRHIAPAKKNAAPLVSTAVPLTAQGGAS